MRAGATRLERRALARVMQEHHRVAGRRELLQGASAVDHRAGVVLVEARQHHRQRDR